MAVDTTPVKCLSFSDIYQIVENRAGIKGDVETRDRNFIKGVINEWYQTIANERNWYWRKFDRAFVAKAATTTGTVAITNATRTATFTSYTLSNSDIDKSLRIGTDAELYRIIGVNTSTNVALLESNYVGSTTASSTIKLYSYETSVPGDYENMDNLYVDSPAYGLGEIRYVSVLDFNRLVANYSGDAGKPRYYTIDGRMINNQNSGELLDQVVLDYDFLSGDISDSERRSKLRIFPLDPGSDTVVHTNYALNPTHMSADDDRPLIPMGRRWMLVHFALSEWFSVKGEPTLAKMAFDRGQLMLKEMRLQHRKFEAKPQLILDQSRYTRKHTLGSDRLEEFYAAREVNY